MSIIFNKKNSICKKGDKLFISFESPYFGGDFDFYKCKQENCVKIDNVVNQKKFIENNKISYFCYKIEFDVINYRKGGPNAQLASITESTKYNKVTNAIDNLNKKCFKGGSYSTKNLVKEYIIVAKIRGQVIAYLSVFFDNKSKEFSLWDVCRDTDKKFYGKGIGRKLINFTLDYLHKKKIEKVYLFAWVDTKKSINRIGYYTLLGFKPVIPPVYDKGLKMVKNLQEKKVIEPSTGLKFAVIQNENISLVKFKEFQEKCLLFNKKKFKDNPHFIFLAQNNNEIISLLYTFQVKKGGKDKSFIYNVCTNKNIKNESYEKEIIRKLINYTINYLHTKKKITIFYSMPKVDTKNNIDRTGFYSSLGFEPLIPPAYEDGVGLIMIKYLKKLKKK